MQFLISLIQKLILGLLITNIHYMLQRQNNLYLLMNYIFSNIYNHINSAYPYLNTLSNYVIFGIVPWENIQNIIVLILLLCKYQMQLTKFLLNFMAAINRNYIA